MDPQRKFCQDNLKWCSEICQKQVQRKDTVSAMSKEIGWHALIIKNSQGRQTHSFFYTKVLTIW